MFDSVSYRVGPDGFIDYDALEALAEQEHPKMMIFGSTSYPRELNWERLGQIADKVGAVLVADISHTAGLVAAGVHTNPNKYAHVITSTTHKTLAGPRGAFIGITDKGMELDPEMYAKIRKWVFPGIQGGPHMENITAFAVALHIADTDEFRDYARQIVANAQTLSDELLSKGHRLVTGGTDSHLMVLELEHLGLLGNTAAEALEVAGIVANANSVPTDKNARFPTGWRCGTPALTKRGMKEDEMRVIATYIDEVVQQLQITATYLGIDLKTQRNPDERKKIIEVIKPILKNVRSQVKALCEKFPILGNQLVTNEATPQDNN